MLEGADCAKFGSLYEPWAPQQLSEARRSRSYILIDSRNYSCKESWRTYVGEITPEPLTEKNVTRHNLLDGLPIQNVYMSMVQDFGPRLGDEPAVVVEPITLVERNTRPRDTLQQLKVILKGVDESTYECLKDRDREVEKYGTDIDREAARMYITELRNARVGYLDVEDTSKKKQLVLNGVVDSLPLVFGREDNTGMGEERSSERWRIYGAMQE